MKHPALFLDRDGTVMEDTHYPSHPDQVHLISEALPSLRRLKAAGYRLVIISNQSGIGRGRIQPEEAATVHKRFVELLQQEGIELDGLYYCPHAPDVDCKCRKPKPGLLLQAARELDLDLSRSVMVGDKLADVKAGQNAGCPGILYRSHRDDKGNTGEPDFKADDWKSIEDYILSKQKG